MLVSHTVGVNDSVLDQSPVRMVVYQMSLHVLGVDVQLPTIRVGANEVRVDLISLSFDLTVISVLRWLDEITSGHEWVVAADEILGVLSANEVLVVVAAKELLRVKGRLVVRHDRGKACVENQCRGSGKVSSTSGRASVTCVAWVVDVHVGIVRGGWKGRRRMGSVDLAVSGVDGGEA